MEKEPNDHLLAERQQLQRVRRTLEAQLSGVIDRIEEIGHLLGEDKTGSPYDLELERPKPFLDRIIDRVTGHGK